MNNPDLIYEAFLKVLRKSPYGFQVLSDRAFGKLKEVHLVEHSPFRDMSGEELLKRLAELERELGYASSEPKILPPTDEKKTN